MLLKVCLISPYPPQKDGVAEYCRDLAEGLAKKADVTVIAEEVAGSARDETANGVRVRRISSRKSVFRPLAIFRELAREKPGRVHLQYESYGLYGGLEFVTVPLLLVLLKLLGLGSVVTLHSLIVSPAERRADDDYLKAGRLSRGKKYAYQVVRMPVVLALRTLPLWFIVHSDRLKGKVTGSLGLAPERVRVIPLAAARAPLSSVDKQEARRRLGFTAARVLLCFGFISTGKRIDSLISAFHKVDRRIPDCLLVISGIPTDFDPDALDYYRELRLSAARTPGIAFIDRFVAREEVSLLFSAADALVLTYFERWASSGVLSLAVAHGVPVVAPDAGTTGDEVRSSGVGLTYRQGDEDGLADAITRILLDEELRTAVVARISELAPGRSIGVVVDRTLEYYSEIG